MLSAAKAGEVLDQASRIEKIAATLKALAAARLAETDSWRAEGDRSAAHQPARRTGSTVVQAAAAIDTARGLGALPATAAAARARLDYDHRLDWSRTHFTVLDLLDRLCPHCHALKTRKNWSLVEGRGKRALVPPEDRRHPRHAVDPRVNGPPPA